jgi:hypothetical protein
MAVTSIIGFKPNGLTLPNHDSTQERSLEAAFARSRSPDINPVCKFSTLSAIDRIRLD